MTTNYWSIFWKTFAQLASGALLAVQGLDFVTGNGLRDNGTALGLALVLAGIGAAVAALYAFARSAATSALEKAVRSAAQAAAGGLGAVILNQSADLFDLPRVLIAVAVTVAFAFFITYFQNQGTVVTPAP